MASRDRGLILDLIYLNRSISACDQLRRRAATALALDRETTASTATHSSHFSVHAPPLQLGVTKAGHRGGEYSRGLLPRRNCPCRGDEWQRTAA